MRSRAALNATPRGAGISRELVIANVGQATATEIVVALDHGGEDFSRLLARRRPIALEPQEEFAVRVSLAAGPDSFKVIVTWTDPNGEDGRWIGVMTR